MQGAGKWYSLTSRVWKRSCFVVLNDSHALQDNEASPDPFYSEPNRKQLEKAARQIANGQIVTKTIEELEDMEREAKQ